MSTEAAKPTLFNRFLNGIEKSGNKLPDPAILFFYLMVFVWLLSALLAPIDFGEVHPLTGAELRVNSLLTGSALANFLATMVTTFTGFAPLGIVLVAMLGVGVAENSGWIDAGLKKLLNVTPKMLLTPMLILIAIVSHTAADAGYILVIPLGGVIFYAAGRHPLAGIAAAFAGVSGGFSANFIPSAIDPLIMSFTLEAARILDPEIALNPLNNIYFTGISSILIVLVGWFVTDKIVEPRLAKTVVDGDEEAMPQMEDVSDKESRAFWMGFGAMILGIVGLIAWAIPADSALRGPDMVDPEVMSLTSFNAPLMQAIVPLIFIFLLIPGVVYGVVSGKYSS